MTFNRSLRKKPIVAAVRLDEICVVLVDNALFLINTIISFSFKMSIGGFHKFGKPVFPLRRQYPKQRREPQHRSDVEAFL